MGVDSRDPLIYHTPEDNVFNISPERMKMTLDVIGTSVYNVLQQSPEQDCLIMIRATIQKWWLLLFFIVQI